MLQTLLHALFGRPSGDKPPSPKPGAAAEPAPVTSAQVVERTERALAQQEAAAKPEAMGVEAELDWDVGDDAPDGPERAAAEAPRAPSAAVETPAAPAAPADPAAEASDDAPVLVWAPNRARQFFYDALAPLAVRAMAGQAVRAARYQDAGPRLLAGGAISDQLAPGVVQVWGAGLATIDAAGADAPQPFVAPAGVAFDVRALRGPLTAAGLRAAGVPCPDVFGDPSWFAAKLFDVSGVAPEAEIGVILPAQHADAENRPARYDAPESLAGAVRLIDPYCEPTLEAWTAKAREIRACRRILCAAPPMIPFVDALNTPMAVLVGGRAAPARLALGGEGVRLAQRIQDAMLGLGADSALVVRAPMDAPIDWEAAMAAIDADAAPAGYNPMPFYAAAPFDAPPPLGDGRWPAPPDLKAVMRA